MRPTVFMAKAVRASLREVDSIRVQLRPPHPPWRALTDQLPPSAGSRPDEVLSWMREQTRHRFYFWFDTVPAILARCARMAGNEYGAQIISDAERIVSHNFDLLGSGPVDLGPHIPWRRDIATGRQWPLRPQAELPVTYRDGSDVIRVWELSRFQYLPTLGKAYHLTGSPRYALEFRDQIQSWMRSNPVGRGPNWMSTQDVALRAINWTLGFLFFAEATEIEPDFWMDYLCFLYQHGLYVMENPPLRRNHEGEPVTNNHYITYLTGLIWMGLLFADTLHGSNWLSLAHSELLRQLAVQVLPDGTDYESSIACYHRLVTEHIASCFILLWINGHRVPQAAWQTLERMIEFVGFYTRPDGTAPQIGDTDDGRLHILDRFGDWDRQDHRHLVALGGELFDRDDLREAAGRTWEDPEWMLYRMRWNGDLPIVTHRSARAVGNRSCAFRDAGFFISRSEHGYAIIAANEVGMDGCGNHKHNDILSLEIYTDGRPVIVDPGSYVYTADFEARNQFRSTAYHNTVQVDELEINPFEPDELFRMREQAHPVVSLWRSTEAYDLFEGHHIGYADYGVVHRRRIFCNKRTPVWIISDWLEPTEESTAEHTFWLRYHFSDQCVVAEDDCQVPPHVIGSLAQIGDTPLVLRFPPLAFAVSNANQTVHLAVLDGEAASMKLEWGWISPRYGSRKRAPIAVFRKQGQCPLTFLTAIWADRERGCA
jgi:hypothetical protein